MVEKEDILVVSNRKEDILKFIVISEDTFKDVIRFIVLKGRVIRDQIMQKYGLRNNQLRPLQATLSSEDLVKTGKGIYPKPKLIELYKIINHQGYQGQNRIPIQISEVNASDEGSEYGEIKRKTVEGLIPRLISLITLMTPARMKKLVRCL